MNSNEAKQLKPGDMVYYDDDRTDTGKVTAVLDRMVEIFWKDQGTGRFHPMAMGLIHKS